jgi:1,4-dihydroxy-2-naphthoate octaprenyltransferase
MNHRANGFRTMKNYLKALRAPFLAGSLIPVIISAAYAYSENTFSLTHCLMAALGVVGLHLGANLINDYYDARGSDPINIRFTPFSGGSRVIQDKQVPPSIIGRMAFLTFGLGVAVGIWFIFLDRPLVIGIGLLGLAAGWSYSAPPLQLMSRGWGEVLIFVAFGPLITLGAYYAMSGSLSLTALALGIPQGFFITEVIWINQFPDYEADRLAGKRNLVVRLGPGISRYLYAAMMALAFGSVIIWVIVAGLSSWSLLSFMALPLGYKATRILWRAYLSHEDVIPAQALTILTLVCNGILLSLGLFLSGVKTF